MLNDLIAAAAVRVIRPRCQKAMRVLLLRLPAVKILKSKKPALQKHSTLHLVGVHNLQHTLGGDGIGVPFGGDQLIHRAVGTDAPPLPAGAHFPVGFGSGDALHKMYMGINNFHSRYL